MPDFFAATRPGREVTHGRFTIGEAKAVIAEGPPAALVESVAEEPAEPQSAVLGLEADFVEIAEELERAAAHARTAIEHLKSGDVPGGLAQGFSVGGHLHAARRMLDHRAENHSSVAGRRA